MTNSINTANTPTFNVTIEPEGYAAAVVFDELVSLDDDGRLTVFIHGDDQTGQCSCWTTDLEWEDNFETAEEHDAFVAALVEALRAKQPAA